MATIKVRDANNQDRDVEMPLPPGRAAAANSRPVALSSEDKAVLDDARAALVALSDLISDGALAVSGEFEVSAPEGGATEAKQDALLTRIGDLATEETLAAAKGALDAVEALIETSNGKLDTLAGHVDAVETLIAATNGALAAIDGHVDGIEAAFETLNGNDFATEETLAAVLAKLIDRPATEAKQDTGNSALAAIQSLLGGTGALRDAGPAWPTARGLSGEPFSSEDQSGAEAPCTDAPTSGQAIVVDDIVVSVAGAMAVTFTEETSGDVVLGPLYLPENGTLQITPRGRLRLAAGRRLMVRTSAAGAISVQAFYHSEV